MRAAIVLSGLHRVERGAEVALENVGRELACLGHEVTLYGSGRSRDAQPYRFVHAGCVRRERFERWPRIPILRSEYVYEEATFMPGLLGAYRPREHDVTLTCSYPFTNWFLRARRSRRRPGHVFVTQNGDWPAQASSREYRWFACEGLVCINPEYFERHRERWRCALIPNGVDVGRFAPGVPDRARFGLPNGVPVVLIASALIPSKRVLEGIRAASRASGVFLFIAGDGPLRDEVDALGRELLGERFARRRVPAAEMPALYRAADVLLHMSRDEPFGNVYIEALASGLGVVAHDAPNTRWIVGGDESLADTGDPDAAARAIEHALAARGPASSERRRRRALERFAWPIVGAAYARFLEEVIGARG